ncbi:hypothetical protein BmR1_04g08580 [Babesia microti strain RI]|uniref:Uncharacterized protein n=1 Tax=Babesia microti (strain RI) TaxID=1133968 RepID=I7J9I2_BABMR|nr:hypothetical protein BmR1_04g08580 [Babesia microti strain RI]CCF75893.1 hypothetical protein BmR1_04g08580 [Babesia microti strain RI]|eukprot:XP_012650301.1 hypothetical protein BmR1_04g08580 [Babesia microti strain RI]
MSKKNNRRAHQERFHIIAKAQIQDELKRSQKRLNKQIQKSVLNKFGYIYIAEHNQLKTNDVKMKSVKSNIPEGYIRRRNKKILDVIRKRERKGAKIVTMKLD